MLSVEGQKVLSDQGPVNLKEGKDYNEKVSAVNQGTNAGRICWLIAGNLCNQEVQGEFNNKLGNCTKCDFFKKVFEEEGSEFNYGMRLMSKLKNS